ncbi:MAG TPA: sterol desaturase family protein [Pirellulaceae bacterium]|nr:sterol desaturase family protein [Pirellulaceae bacterium]HMO93525.1 sterol desaturase family protein [Pirellulaceae bacterium]HMP70363.1 sterol desaturase family protein [Pirellulaceae bacterium]
MFDWKVITLCAITFLFALLIGTFVEYIVHRLMHAGKLFYKIHAQHHQANQGQGWLWEFRDYYLPSLPISIVGFIVFWMLWGLYPGASFFVGCFLYAALAAYAHQIQHERPELCFWMARPVHYLHHNGKMWHHNFGILVDFWDRIFGTYKRVDPPEHAQRKRGPLTAYFKIKWF